LQSFTEFLLEEEADFRAALHVFQQQYQGPQELLDYTEALRQVFEESCDHLFIRIEGLRSYLTESEAPNNTTTPEATGNTTTPEATDNAMAPEAPNNTLDTFTEPEANAGSSDNAAVAAAASAPAVAQSILRRLSRTKSGRVTKDRTRRVSFKETVETSNDMPDEASINITEPEASSQSIEPEASVQNMELEVPAQSMEPGASAQSLEPGASVRNTEPEDLVQNMESVEVPAQPNNTPTSESLTNQTATEIPTNVSRFSTWSSEVDLTRQGAQTENMDIEAADNPVATRAPEDINSEATNNTDSIRAPGSMDIEVADNPVAAGAPTQTMGVEEPGQPNNTAANESPESFWTKAVVWIPQREVLPKFFSDNGYQWWKRGFLLVALFFALIAIALSLLCHFVSLDSRKSNPFLEVC
jgi:hypothetical protein